MAAGEVQMNGQPWLRVPGRWTRELGADAGYEVGDV